MDTIIWDIYWHISPECFDAFYSDLYSGAYEGKVV